MVIKWKLEFSIGNLVYIKCRMIYKPFNDDKRHKNNFAEIIINYFKRNLSLGAPRTQAVCLPRGPKY